MAVVANEDGDIVMEDPLGQENTIVADVSGELEEDDEEEEGDTSLENLKLRTQITRNKSESQSSQHDPKLRKDMENCFGFDEVC